MKSFWGYKKAVIYGAVVGLAYNLLQLILHSGLGAIGHVIGYLLGGAIMMAILFVIVAAVRNYFVTGSVKPTIIDTMINDNMPVL